MVHYCIKLFTCILAYSFMHYKVQGIAVMSVDLGSEWMKVAIVSPGVPMEIALNRESQRKTPVTVAFREGERLFGEPALSIGVRFPEKSYSYILEVIGKKLNNPLIELYKRRFPFYTILSNDERGTVVFKHPEGLSFTPEELLAMVLKQAQEIGQKAAGQPIKDAVITVPPYFNQAERRALMQAAEMTGLNVLQLINSNTAVALNYGVFRRRDFNETPTNIVFYDMGAGSTVATVVTYQIVKSKDSAETSPQLTVRGVGFDRTLGGLEMQLRLRDHFAKAFNNAKKSSNDVFKNNRAMAKLLKEAGRIKKVLSANSDHVAQVESLLDDKDFKCPITRAEFEDLCSDLFERVTKPVEIALQSANMTMDDIDQVILAGSGARIPKVQQKLLEFVQKPELGKSINTDESAALGAAYQAAYLSKGFKVKTFLIKDANVYPIQVDFQRDIELDDKVMGQKSVRRTLFNRNNVMPQKKIMTFSRHIKDFEFFVNYGELNFLNEFELQALGSLNISKVSLSGIESALAKHTSENTENKGVKAHFKIDESGILKIEQVEFVFEKTGEEEEAKESDIESAFAKLGSTIGKLFSSGSSSSTEDEEASKKDKDSMQHKEKEEKVAEDSNTSDTKDNQKHSEKEATKPASETGKLDGTDKNATVDKKGPKIITIKEPLLADKISVDLPDMDENQIALSISKLQSLDERDRSKLAKEKTKNSLESFILETKEKLFMEEYELASTEEERDNIHNTLTQVGDWLEYESSDSTTEVFKDKLSELRKLTRELFERVKEHRERPEALKALQEMLNISEIFLKGARNMSEDDQIFTEVELKTLEKLINDTKEWKQESEAEQATIALSSQPKLTTKIISEKVGNLDREVKYLLNKARFSAPSKKKKTVNETKAEKSSQENNDTKTGFEEVQTNDSESRESSKPEAESEKQFTVSEDDGSQVETADEEDQSQTTEKPSPESVKDEPHTEL